MPIVELFLNLHNHRSTANFSETDISELKAISQLFPLNFDETGDQIKSILEKRYTDGISGFKDVKVEGSKIVGIFYDIVSPALTKSFNFTIDSDTGAVDYTQINSGNLEPEHSEYEFAAPAKKSKQCNQGKSSACTRPDGSVYCIKVGYKCKSVRLSQQEKIKAQAIVSQNKLPKTQLPSKNNQKKRNSSLKELAKIPSQAELQNNKNIILVGVGKNGKVYIDRSTNPPRAIKYGIIGENELKISKLMSQLGLSPKIFSEQLEEIGVDPKTNEKTQAFSMEFVEGKTLRESDGTTGKEYLVKPKHFEDILKMRRKMHESGIYNTDMHPGNIIIKPDDSPTIIDLGFTGNDSYYKVYQDLRNHTFVNSIAKKTEDSEAKKKYLDAIDKLKLISYSSAQTMTDDDFKKKITDFYKELYDEK